MKTKLYQCFFALLVCSAILAALPLTAATATQTNLSPGVVSTATVPASPWPIDAAAPNAANASWHWINGQWTNTATPDGMLLAKQATAPKREVRSTRDGAVADFSRHLARFAPDASQPVHLTLPGGQVMRWRIAFLA